MFRFLLFLHFTLCSSRSSILKNQTLKDGEFLISKEKNFCLGFFSPGRSSLRYLGIWFHKIPGQTVIWVANRNSPINGSLGVVSINRWGNLVLHSNNNLIWSTNVSVEATDSMVAEILDSGNLVLVLKGGSKEIMWQSFDHPTNTLVRGMKLGMSRRRNTKWFLTSWRSAEDPGTGNYSLRLNSSGSPQFFAYNDNKPYWRTSPWPWKTFPQPYNYSFVNSMEEIYYILAAQDDSVINRLVFDDSGQIRWLTWHDTSKEWKEFWSLPKHRCDFYGKCGPNSKCNYNVLNMFECICLPGYEPKNAREWFLRDGSGGCIRKRLDTSSVCGRGEGFMKVENVCLPDSSAAEWLDMSKSVSNTKCEQECKSNCLCTAYASLDIPGNETGCLVWYGELMDTRNYVGYAGYDLYVRVDALELADSVRRSSNSREKGIMLSMLIIFAASAMFLFVYGWLRMRKQKRMKKKTRRRRLSTTANGSNRCKNKLDEDNEIEAENRSHSDLVHFNLRDILSATNNFSAANRIGEGGFGTVYKGQLSNGQEIAVKRMSEKSRQGVEELKNEAILIAKLQHRNLVKLIGCCIHKKEQILIYEYLQNKSLDAFLFDRRRRLLLDWEKCFNIIVGIARGILYLHQDSRLRIIHRDLKSSNILLDDEMNPKISDFGMARLLKNDQIQGKTRRVVGTYGYMPPEYAVFGKFSVKSDVFSFGVILLEIISGKRSNGYNQKDPSLSLIGQVWKLWNEERTLEIVDSSLTESLNSEEVVRCIQIGLLCVQEDAMERPTMLEVILMLKSETSLPSPKQPAFIFTTYSCDAKLTLGQLGSCSINEATVSVLSAR